jgi:hypothetical protein
VPPGVADHLAPTCRGYELHWLATLQQLGADTQLLNRRLRAATFQFQVLPGFVLRASCEPFVRLGLAVFCALGSGTTCLASKGLLQTTSISVGTETQNNPI